MTVDEAFAVVCKQNPLWGSSGLIRQWFEAGWEAGHEAGYAEGYDEGENDGTNAESDRHEPPDIERNER